MKTINLKKGMFVYELGKQKLYETVEEVLEDYPHASVEHINYTFAQPDNFGIIRSCLFTEEYPAFMQLQKPYDVFEILD